MIGFGSMMRSVAKFERSLIQAKQSQCHCTWLHQKSFLWLQQLYFIVNINFLLCANDLVLPAHVGREGGRVAEIYFIDKAPEKSMKCSLCAQNLMLET